ncbi:MAG: CoA-binding protein [Gammaproteobacteria bacterium]|nr:CoA-binding protein [Gammaproteobacteria bacterium]
MTTTPANKTTLVMGASEEPTRFANRAQIQLQQHGIPVVLVSPKYKTINGVTVKQSLNEVSESIDTVTVYVRPEILESSLNAIIHLAPRRLIFNPGTESNELQKRLINSDIEVINDCTLVMLSENRY